MPERMKRYPRQSKRIRHTPPLLAEPIRGQGRTVLHSKHQVVGTWTPEAQREPELGLAKPVAAQGLNHSGGYATARTLDRLSANGLSMCHSRRPW